MSNIFKFSFNPFLNTSIYILFSLIIVCRDAGASSEIDVWQNEALQQLSEIRKNQIQLRKAVAELKFAVEELRAKNSAVKSEFIPFRSPNVLGDASARVAILEFSDFECPYCARYATQVFPKIKSEFIDKGLVKYGLSDYPLSFHPGAKDAATAVRCAGEQNKYWEMYSKIFNDRGESRSVNYKPLAQELSLNTLNFETCMANPMVKAAVESDIAFGESLGVDGTPRFIVGAVENGVFKNPKVIKGARNFEVFKNAISGLLSK